MVSRRSSGRTDTFQKHPAVYLRRRTGQRQRWEKIVAGLNTKTQFSTERIFPNGKQIMGKNLTGQGCEAIHICGLQFVPSSSARMALETDRLLLGTECEPTASSSIQ